jgi:hypothetical protein
VAIVTSALEAMAEFETLLCYGLLSARTDRRCSAIHVTIYAALMNFSGFVHKLHVYYLVETLGIYLPHALFTIITVWAIFRLRTAFLGLERANPALWHLSLKKLKQT